STIQRGKPPEWWEKQKGSRGIRRGQWYRLVFQFPIRERVKESANVAITAYNHAIGTALAEASANKASTASAVAALVPDSVLDELNKAAR
ncbi:hypothetical protein ACJHWL_24315, partial [Escherichia sp. WS1038]